MNKVGYIISLIGGVLAVFFSVMLIATGPVLTIGPEALDFYTENEDDLYHMWTQMGEYNEAVPFLAADFEDYLDAHADMLDDLDARELSKMASQYDNDAFDELAGIFEDKEDYLPKLKLGVIGCLAASVLALIGAETARRFRITGSVMVLSGAALTLVFSLVGGAIVPMAAASLLLILGGVFQILVPSEKARQNAQKNKRELPKLRSAAFGIGFAGSVLGLIFALLMIFTVPVSLVSQTIEDLKDDIENEHVVAFNETVLAMGDKNINVYSEEAVMAFATEEVAPKSLFINDEGVYKDAIEFVYSAGTHAAVSMLIVGITVVLALISFIGALICRRAPIGGGIMMLFCALTMLLAAIYTDTLVPMVIASGLLAVAGIIALAPTPVPMQISFRYARTPQQPASVPQQPMIPETNDASAEEVPFPDDAPPKDAPFTDELQKADD